MKKILFVIFVWCLFVGDVQAERYFDSFYKSNFLNKVGTSTVTLGSNTVCSNLGGLKNGDSGDSTLKDDYVPSTTKTETVSRNLPYKVVMLIDNTGSLEHSAYAKESCDDSNDQKCFTTKLAMMNETIANFFTVIKNYNTSPDVVSNNSNAANISIHVCLFNGGCTEYSVYDTAPQLSASQLSGATHIQQSLVTAKGIFETLGFSTAACTTTNVIPLALVLTDGYMNKATINGQEVYFNNSSPATHFYNTLLTMRDLKSSLCNIKLGIYAVGMSANDPLGNYLINPNQTTFNNLNTTTSSWNESQNLYNILNSSQGSNVQVFEAIASLGGSPEYGIYKGTGAVSSSSDEKTLITFENMVITQELVNLWKEDSAKRLKFYIPASKRMVSSNLEAIQYQLNGTWVTLGNSYTDYSDNKKTKTTWSATNSMQKWMLNGVETSFLDSFCYDGTDSNEDGKCDSGGTTYIVVKLNAEKVARYLGEKYWNTTAYKNASGATSRLELGLYMLKQITGFRIRLNREWNDTNFPKTTVSGVYNYSNFNNLVDFSGNLSSSSLVNSTKEIVFEDKETVTTTIPAEVKHTPAVEKNISVDMYVKTSDLLYEKAVGASNSSYCSPVTVSVPVIIQEGIAYEKGTLSSGSSSNSNIYAGGGFLWTGAAVSNEIIWYYKNFINERGGPLVNVEYRWYLKKSNGAAVRLDTENVPIDMNNLSESLLLQNLYFNSSCSDKLGTNDGIIRFENAVSEQIYSSLNLSFDDAFTSVNSNDANANTALAVNSSKSVSSGSFVNGNFFDYGLGSSMAGNVSSSGCKSYNGRQLCNNYVLKYDISLKSAYINKQTYTVVYNDMSNNSNYDYAGQRHYIPIDYLENNAYVETNKNFSSVLGIDINIQNKCYIGVEHLFIENGKIKIKYRSIDVDDPFPKASFKSDYPANWQDWYCGTDESCNSTNSNKLRISNSYYQYTKNNPLYKISFANSKEALEKIKESTVSYTNWSGINNNGVSNFVYSNFDIRNNSQSFCPIGVKVSDSCDRYSSVGG